MQISSTVLRKLHKSWWNGECEEALIKRKRALNQFFTVEQKPLNFTSQNDDIYNKIYSMRELQDYLKNAHDTAIGPDDSHYQILKQMPWLTLEVKLDIYNEIWNNGEFPSHWREATIIQVP